MTSTDLGTRKDSPSGIMKRLKEETKECHLKLEVLPYIRFLIDRKLPLESYVNQLRALAIIHGVLESELAACEDGRIKEIWEDGLRKLPLLEKDLAFFAPRIVADADSCIAAAHAMTEKIRIRGIEQPLTLLGYLYVMEGSTLGNTMHLPDISAIFRLRGADGCSYYASYQEQVHKHWKQFAKKMNSMLDDPSSYDSIIAAAREAFSGLQVLYTALYPLAKTDKRFHVTRINPEAGNHPIPADEREIEAALRASARGWNEFPYFAHRYGERGRRFADSDSCWLATLVALDEEIVQGQIDWLCRLLATRGMPSLLLERSLLFLYEELLVAVPDKQEGYEKLRTQADRFRQARGKRLPEAEVDSMVVEFERAVGAEMAATYRNTGQLLAAAVADERNGIEGAVASMRAWLADAERFSAPWIAAVDESIARAQSAAA